MAEARKKVWRKPEVRVIEAGSAENQNSNHGSDGATTGPKRS